MRYLTLRHKNTHISKPLLACQNALKLTYSNVEFHFFPRENPGPSGEGSEGAGEGKGREGSRATLASGPQNHNPSLTVVCMLVDRSILCSIQVLQVMINRCGEVATNV